MAVARLEEGQHALEIHDFIRSEVSNTLPESFKACVHDRTCSYYSISDLWSWLHPQTRNVDFLAYCQHGLPINALIEVVETLGDWHDIGGDCYLPDPLLTIASDDLEIQCAGYEVVREQTKMQCHPLPLVEIVDLADWRLLTTIHIGVIAIGYPARCQTQLEFKILKIVG